MDQSVAFDQWNISDFEKQNSSLPPPYFNLLLPPSSLRLSVVLCSLSSTFPCKMNGTDVVRQDSSTPWFPSPHYSLSMRSETCFLIIVPPPNLSLLWGLIDTQAEGRWGDQELPNQRGEDRGAPSHVSGIWRKHIVKLFQHSKELTGQDRLCLWTTKISECFEGMDGTLRP